MPNTLPLQTGLFPFPKVPFSLLYFSPPALQPPSWHAFFDLPNLGKSPPEPTSRIPHRRPSFPKCPGLARTAPERSLCWSRVRGIAEGSDGRHPKRLQVLGCRGLPSPLQPQQQPRLGRPNSQLGFGALAVGWEDHEAFPMAHLT